MQSLLRLLQAPRSPSKAPSVQRDSIGFVLDDGRHVDVLRVRDPRARRIKLSVDERGARLSLPLRASLVAGERFLHEHRDWLGLLHDDIRYFAPIPSNLRRDHLPTEQRQLGMLFQDDVLFPHLSVGHNLAFALPASVVGRRARREVVEATLASVDLSGFHDRDPATLSGGQRARVSLMRALLAQPQALLLDEPFAKLDMALRARFRELVFAQTARLNLPVLLVTHDPADVPAGGRVITLGDVHAGLAPDGLNAQLSDEATAPACAPPSVTTPRPPHA